MQQNRKKWLPLLGLLLAALVAELVICNFSAWKSLFYKNREVFSETEVEGGTETEAGSGEYIVNEGILTVHIPHADRELHNLFFAVSFSENTEVPYTVTLTDEGNYYPYSLPEQVLVPEIERTYYTNVYPSGKVGEITVQFTVPTGSVMTVKGIGADARIPFVFSASRLITIVCVLLLVYAGMDRHLWQVVCDRSAVQRFFTALVILVLFFTAWKMAHVNPICITSPWPHHRQYQELAEAMAKGQLYLDMEPSEELQQVENPYDTIYLQANGINYCADYAYYQGKYYVYFGVVPEILLYLPGYLLTGKHLPNYMAVFLFYCGFIVAVFGLYREMIKRWFVKTPYFVYLVTCVLTVCCGNYLFVIARPDLYDTPIIAANMFTVLGLWLWIRGKYTDSPKGKRICFLLGSLSMALVAGCRPQMLLFSFLAIPLFWEEVIRKRELFGRKGLWETVSLGLPYLLVAAGIMYYNQARFGSPFDFGATYSLTSNDMTKRSFQLYQAWLGVWHYFIKPPVITDEFPFLQGMQVASGNYMGKLNGEYTYGGMVACNVFLWVLPYIKRGKEELKKRGIYALAVMSAVIAVILGIVDVTGAGILQRYMVDMIWGVWFCAVILWFGLVQEYQAKGKLRTIAFLLVIVCLLQAVYGFGVIFGNGDLSVNVRTSNPVLYYQLKTLWQWLP